MQVLIADDDAVTRRALRVTIEPWGYEVVEAATGTDAWDVLREGTPPPLAIVDWMMPGMDGPELCRRVRSAQGSRPAYLILLTAKRDRTDLVAGLDAGADDYITKPFDRDELRARLQVGVRVIGLQQALATRVGELEEALAQVRQLQGLLPICSYCKRIRSDKNYWEQIETYLGKHSDAKFTHGICPTCLADLMRAEE